MKTVTKEGNYSRVSNKEAELRVKSGWSFCPKSEWKKNDRDFGKEEAKPKKKKED